MRLGVLGLVIVCGAIPGALGCTHEEPMSIEDAFAAVGYAATLSHVDATLANSLSFLALADQSGGPEALESYLRRNSWCVSIQRTDNVFDLYWNGCLHEAARLSGHQVVTLERAEAGLVEARSEWSSFTDGTVSVAGTGRVRWTPTRGLTLTYDLAWSTPSFSATSKGEQVLGVEHSDGVLVTTASGTDRADTTSGHFEIVATNMRVRSTTPIADSGTLAVTSPSGKHATILLTPIDATHVRVDFEGLESPFSIILSPKTHSPIQE